MRWYHGRRGGEMVHVREDMVEFGLLGPLLVRRGDAVVPVPAGKQRAVLAALLLNANHIVPRRIWSRRCGGQRLRLQRG